MVMDTTGNQGNFSSGSGNQVDASNSSKKSQVSWIMLWSSNFSQRFVQKFPKLALWLPGGESKLFRSATKWEELRCCCCCWNSWTSQQKSSQRPLSTDRLLDTRNNRHTDKFDTSLLYDARNTFTFRQINLLRHKANLANLLRAASQTYSSELSLGFLFTIQCNPLPEFTSGHTSLCSSPKETGKRVHSTTN